MVWFHVVGGLKQAVQLGQGGFLGAEEIHQAVYVLGHQPEVLPGRSLGVVGGLVTGVDGVEGLGKGAVRLAAAEELGLGIPEMSPGVAALGELGGQVLLSQEGGGIGQSGIGNGVFHIVGYGFGVKVGRNVAVGHAEVLSAVRHVGGGHHGVQDLLVAQAGVVALYNGIGKDNVAFRNKMSH